MVGFFVKLNQKEDKKWKLKQITFVVEINTMIVSHKFNELFSNPISVGNVPLSLLEYG
jgi:hypothetical protein